MRGCGFQNGVHWKFVILVDGGRSRPWYRAECRVEQDYPLRRHQSLGLLATASRKMIGCSTPRLCLASWGHSFELEFIKTCVLMLLIVKAGCWLKVILCSSLRYQNMHILELLRVLHILSSEKLPVLNIFSVTAGWDSFSSEEVAYFLRWYALRG